MSRRTEAPVGFECPYRHRCPHLDGLSTPWTLEVYQESFELRNQYHVMEERCPRRIAELEKTLRERDDKIAQLRLQHQKQFKGNVRPEPPPARGVGKGKPFFTSPGDVSGVLPA